MTRRIAMAILLTVWATLIAGWLTAYFTVRWALVEQFDRAMMTRASAIPELARPAPASDIRPPPESWISGPMTDRYVMRTDAGRTLTPPAGGQAPANVTVVGSDFVTLQDGSRLRSLTLRAAARTERGIEIPVTITYQSSARHLDAMLNRLTLLLAVFGLSAGLIAALVAVRVSRAALRPLHETAGVIGSIDQNHLDRRIDPSRLPPELAPVAHRLNEMLERIERAYLQRQQFLADASHELRTPVAAMVTTAEVALRHPRSAESYRQTLESCLADARLMRQLVERLMEQCRAESPLADGAMVEIDLAALLNHCADQAAALGLEQQIQVVRRIPAPLLTVTQPQRLRAIISNLLSNAVEYNRPQGTVELIADPNGEFIEVRVSDTGVGIDPAHLPHIFEPFYRADRSRSPEQHLGLGLSLVQSNVAALGGSIDVESRPGVGTTFSIRLPMRLREDEKSAK